jgi:hypothetical protein
MSPTLEQEQAEREARRERHRARRVELGFPPTITDTAFLRLIAAIYIGHMADKAKGAK